jgi:hypothetical protein
MKCWSWTDVNFAFRNSWIDAFIKSYDEFGRKISKEKSAVGRYGWG